MDWVRNNDPNPEDVDDPTIQSLANLAGVPIPKKLIPPEKKKPILDETMNWLRNNEPTHDVDEPTLQKLANLTNNPIPSNIPPETKKKIIDDTMDWVRNNDPNPEDVDDPTIQSLANLAGVPIPKKLIPPEKKKPILDETMNWLRNNEPNHDVDEPTLQKLANLTNNPIPSNIPPETKKKIIDDTMDWIRNNDPNPEDVDDSTIQSLANLAGVPIPKKLIPPEKKKPILDEIMNWLRNNEPNHDVDEPTLHNLGNLPNHPLDNRNKRILDEVVYWIRNAEPKDEYIDEPTLVALSKLSGLPIPQHILTTEEKAEILEQAVDWIRNNEIPEDLDEPTVEILKNIPGLPLTKPILKPEDRSKVLNEALDWLRNNASDSDDEPDDFSANNLPAETISVQSMDSSDHDNDDHPAWDWNRNRPSTVDDPTPSSFQNFPPFHSGMSRDIPERNSDGPLWDWNRNRPIDDVDNPDEHSLNNLPNKPQQGRQDHEDHPSWDWNRNRPNESMDGPTPQFFQNVPHITGHVSPGENPSWDWNRNRPMDYPEEPTPYALNNIPGVMAHANPSQLQNVPEENPSWDWNRNRPPQELDLPSPQEFNSMPGHYIPPSGEDADVDFVRNKPFAEYEIDRFETPYFSDGIAPWSSSPDEESVSGRRPKPAKVPRGPEDEDAEMDFTRNKPDDEDDAEMDFTRNKPVLSYEIDHFDTPDIDDFAEPWSSSPDEQTDSGKRPKPMGVPNGPDDDDAEMDFTRNKPSSEYPVDFFDTPHTADESMQWSSMPDEQTDSGKRPKPMGVPNGPDDDDAEMDFTRNKPSSEYPVDFFNTPHTADEAMQWSSMPDEQSEGGRRPKPMGVPVGPEEDEADMDFARNIPSQEFPVEYFENPPTSDSAAPWSSSPEEESDGGKRPKPMNGPEDSESEYTAEFDFIQNKPPPATSDYPPDDSESEYTAEFDFMQNKPPPGIPDYPLDPVENPDVVDGSAPWATSPDEESEKGLGPKPMAVPDDLYSNPSSEDSKEEPKGTVVPVWLFLTAAVLASVVGATAVSGPPPTQVGIPPNMLVDPTVPIAGSPPTLPNLPNAPSIPAALDPATGFIQAALDPVFPPSTAALINVPGTCQNWSREWLRTGKDIMEFQVNRIRQRFAMALMYCEFNGDNWLENELWVSELHECDWYGMIGVDPCSRDETYQIIRNYGQQMRGTLPPEMAMLTNLWEIELSDNLLSGTIPTDFARLTDLDTFRLSFNLFNGKIPDFMWEFEDMVFMDLSYNFFTGTIPDTVHLTEPNLRVLFVENNDLSGTIPSTFGNLDWKLLHMNGNNFKGTIPSDIYAARMEELMLHNNELTGTFPAESFANDFPGTKSKLTKLTFNNNNLEGDISELSKLELEVLQYDTDKVSMNG
jgi:hypothetical protein